jgi:hypothetical protein
VRRQKRSEEAEEVRARRQKSQSEEAELVRLWWQKRSDGAGSRSLRDEAEEV